MADFIETIDMTGAFNWQFPANGEDNQLTATIDLPPNVSSLTINIQGATGNANDGLIDTVVLNTPPGFTVEPWFTQPLTGSEVPPAQNFFYFLRNDAGTVIGTVQISANNVTIVEDYVPVCFVEGTKLLMANGTYQSVENICEGDFLATKDNGPQPVKWVAKTMLSARMVGSDPRYTPICFQAGAVGNTEAFQVSPQHQLLIKGDMVELHFATDEVIAPAHTFVNDTTVHRMTDIKPVTYYHVLMEQHELIMAEGIWAESLDPNSMAMISSGGILEYEAARSYPNEITTVRPSLTGWEARLATDVVFSRPQNAAHQLETPADQS